MASFPFLWCIILSCATLTQFKSRYFMEYDVFYDHTHGFPIDVCHFFELDWKFVIYKCDITDPNNHIVTKYSHPFKYPNCDSPHPTITTYRVNYTAYPYSRHTFNCVDKDNYYSMDQMYFDFNQNTDHIIIYARTYFVTNLCFPIGNNMYALDTCDQTAASYKIFWNDKCDEKDVYQVFDEYYIESAQNAEYEYNHLRQCVLNDIVITNIPLCNITSVNLLPTLEDGKRASFVIAIVAIFVVIVSMAIIHQKIIIKRMTNIQNISHSDQSPRAITQHNASGIIIQHIGGDNTLNTDSGSVESDNIPNVISNDNKMIAALTHPASNTVSRIYQSRQQPVCRRDSFLGSEAHNQYSSEICVIKVKLLFMAYEEDIRITIQRKWTNQNYGNNIVDNYDISQQVENALERIDAKSIDVGRIKQTLCGNYNKCERIVLFDPRLKLLCKGCQNIYYCSHKCHKWHWKYYHRFVCYK